MRECEEFIANLTNQLITGLPPETINTLLSDLSRPAESPIDALAVVQKYWNPLGTEHLFAGVAIGCSDLALALTGRIHMAQNAMLYSRLYDQSSESPSIDA